MVTGLVGDKKKDICSLRGKRKGKRKNGD